MSAGTLALAALLTLNVVALALQAIVLWRVLSRAETSSRHDRYKYPERTFSAGKSSVERSVHSTTRVVGREGR